MAIGDFMRPGVVAATGLDAAEPLLDASADLLGPVGLFTNFVQILILLIAWVIVVLAFFILAVQVFVTILEFKLVTLAGFVLLPFAFFNRTSFMAERVLGHVISSGIKLLVLAMITGIGVTLFERFMQAGLGTEPDIREVMAIALGALTLLGLGIFGPSVANGIVAGGPQLGAGAAAGTTLAAGATIAAGAAGATLATGAAASMGREGSSGSLAGRRIGLGLLCARRGRKKRDARFRSGHGQCGTRRGKRSRIAAAPGRSAPPPELCRRAGRQGGACSWRGRFRTPDMGRGDEAAAGDHLGRHDRRPDLEARRQPWRRLIPRHQPEGLNRCSDDRINIMARAPNR